MTYISSLQYTTALETAVLSCGTPSSASAGGIFSLQGTTTPNSTIVNNKLVLASGYHFYLEGSILTRNASANGAVTWAFHDQSTYIGQEAYMNFAGSFGGNPRIGRRVARALILNTDAAQTVDLRIKSKSGSNWSFAITSVGISSFNYVGYPSLRILELEAN